MMTVVDVAKQLGVGRDAIYLLINSGKLRCHRIGTKTTRITQEQVDAYLASVETKSATLPAPAAQLQPVKSRHFRFP